MPEETPVQGFQVIFTADGEVTRAEDVKQDEEQGDEPTETEEDS